MPDHEHDPDPAASEDNFEGQLREAADRKIENIQYDTVEEGEDTPDDGTPADAVDPDGKRFRVKIEIRVTRHEILDNRNNSM